MKSSVLYYKNKYWILFVSNIVLICICLVGDWTHIIKTNEFYILMASNLMAFVIDCAWIVVVFINCFKEQPVETHPLIRPVMKGDFKIFPFLSFSRASSRPIIVKESVVDSDNLTIFKNKVLGKGGFGTVYKGKYRRFPVAVKVFNEFSKEQVKQLIYNEIQLAMSLEHHCVINYYGCFRKPELCIVMELMSKSLFHFIHENKDDIRNHDLYQIILDIMAGMNYLHTRYPEIIVHKDLSSKNVLLNTNLRAKLCDFGMSEAFLRTANEKRATDSDGGTVPWLAPEYLDDKRKSERSEKGDVYSFGVILWELATRELPWKGFTQLDIVVTVTSGETLEIPEKCEEILKEMMKQCWQFDPKKRPSFYELQRRVKEKFPSDLYFAMFDMEEDIKLS